MGGSVLIIGAGGVGQVVTHKCAQRRDILTPNPVCLGQILYLY